MNPMFPRPWLPSVLLTLVFINGYAFDAGWQLNTPGEIFASATMGPDGTLYVGSRDGRFYALDPEGEILWVFDTDADDTPGDWIDSTATIGPDGTIFVGCWDNFIYALNPDGTLRWAYETGSAILGSPVLDGEVLVAASADGFCYGLNAATGDFLWAYLVDTEVEGSPVVGDLHTVFVGAQDNTVHALDTATGEAIWVTDLSAISGVGIRPTDNDKLVAGLALTDDGLVLAPSQDGLLYALDTITGQLLWSFTASGDFMSQPVIDDNGNIYLGCLDSLLYCIDRNGLYQWAALVGPVYFSSPALGRDGSVFIAGYNEDTGGTSLYQFSDTGVPLDDRSIPAINDSSPILTPDGYLYIGFHDGTLRQYDITEPPREGPWPLFGQTPRREANRTEGYRRPFAAWAVAHLGEDILPALDLNLDSDGDGTALGAEFFMGMDPTVADTPRTALHYADGNLILDVWQQVESLGVYVRGEPAATIDDLGTEDQLLTETGVVENGYRQWELSIPLDGGLTPQFSRLRFAEH